MTFQLGSRKRILSTFSRYSINFIRADCSFRRSLANLRYAHLFWRCIQRDRGSKGTVLRSRKTYARLRFVRLSQALLYFLFHFTNLIGLRFIRSGGYALPPLLLFHFLYFISSFFQPYLTLSRSLEVLDQEFLWNVVKMLNRPRIDRETVFYPINLDDEVENRLGIYSLFPPFFFLFPNKFSTFCTLRFIRSNSAHFFLD